MTSRRSLVVLLLATSLVVAACSGGSSSTGTTSTSSVADGTVPVDSTAGTTTSSSTSTTTPQSTTTHPLIVGLNLLPNGLGDALFGAGVDGVLSYVSSILGDPNNDSGWVDPAASGVACSGTVVRFVRWHDLSLVFSDESPAASGLRHFASYTYGPAEGIDIDPWGLQTEGTIGVGSSVHDLQAVYPDVVVNPADELSGPTFFIEDGLRGFLTGTAATDQVISFVGGAGCGE